METKLCPYCGKEILSNAKKCKHCGKWLEKQCPQCGEWVNSEAKKCRYCGYWFDPWQRRLQEKAEQEKDGTQSGAAAEKAKAATEKEKENKSAERLLVVECVIIAILLDYVCEWAWWGAFVFIVLFAALLSVRFLRIIYCIGISLVWGIVGVALSPYMFDESDLQMANRLVTDDYTDYWWMGLVCAIVSFVFHRPAMRSEFKY